MEILDEVEPGRSRAKLAALFGVASALLLAASMRWAHHWGPVSEAIVAACAVSTIAAFATSVWARRADRGARSAKLGLTLALVSVAALIIAGLAFAAGGAGGDPGRACGGG